MTANSELTTSCASANSVPISAAMGNSSYRRPGMLSATNVSTVVRRVLLAPISRIS